MNRSYSKILKLNKAMIKQIEGKSFSEAKTENAVI